MLDAFATVGVQAFDITHTNIDEEKRGFRRSQTLEQTRCSMPFLLESAPHRLNNIIIRPHQPPAVFLVQLDDLSAAAVERVRPVAFLIVSTSPGNHQAWIALAGESDDRRDLARRLRKGAGADRTASGATRVAGTTNFKRKYAPNFPIVQIVETRPGRSVTAAELEALNLVAPPDVVKEPGTLRVFRRGAKKWPNYQRCVDHAPKAHNSDRPDISRADFTWCMTAIDWGWSIEETTAKLLSESSKARENGEQYAVNTARNAAAPVERRRPDNGTLPKPPHNSSGQP
jgi:RepB DNA-primase from phage plasmid